MNNLKFLSPSNSKTDKNSLLTFLLNLLPVIFCPGATPECTRICFGLFGTYAWKSSKEKQIRNSNLLKSNPEFFIASIAYEINQIVEKHGSNIAIRLNAISDYDFASVSYTSFDGEHYKNIFEQFPTVQFYGYTKVFSKFTDSLSIPNLYLTFSFSARNWSDCKKVLTLGGCVAIPFAEDFNPGSHFEGYPVINGELSDERFNDKPGSVVALSIKANQQNKDSAMIVRSIEQFKETVNKYK